MLAHKLLEFLAGTGLPQATHTLKEYSDTELAHNQSINQRARWGFKDTVLAHKLWQGQPSSGNTHTLIGLYGGEGYSDNVPAHK